MYNVLVFPCGELNSAELHAALGNQVNIQLFGASSVERLGHHLFINNCNSLPNVSDANFIEEFNKLLTQWKIDVIIPTHDSVVTALSDAADQIMAKALVPDKRTAAICRDKARCYEHFSGLPFTPKSYKESEDCEFPIFVKPRDGQGSVGARLAFDKSGINWDTEVVCEYLPGEEVTVDCFTDRKGELLGSFPRTRDRTLGGISVAGRAVINDDELSKIALEINRRLSFLGMWYFQAKRSTDGNWKLLEISARCAGSQCLTRARGVNLPLLSVYTAMGVDVEIRPNTYSIRMDRLLSSRYDTDFEYSTVYIDLDDTITSGSGVNPDMMRLLYQWRNDNKQIFLVTRHAGDVSGTLERLAISTSIFTKIFHLRNKESKCSVIDVRDSVFIDNAFFERNDVSNMLSIPVFDVDTTEILHHWKR